MGRGTAANSILYGDVGVRASANIVSAHEQQPQKIPYVGSNQLRVLNMVSSISYGDVRDLGSAIQVKLHLSQRQAHKLITSLVQKDLILVEYFNNTITLTPLGQQTLDSKK